MLDHDTSGSCGLGCDVVLLLLLGRGGGKRKIVHLGNV